MIKGLTVRQLKASIDGLQSQVRGLDTKVQGLDIKVQGLDTRVKGLETRTRGVEIEIQGLRQEVRQIEPNITAKFSQLRSSVDGYLKKTQDWRQEFDVLKARHDKVSGSLIKKGVLTVDDTTLP